MSEEEQNALAVRGNDGALVSMDQLDDVLGNTEGRSGSMMDALTVYRQGKEDYFKLGDEKTDECFGIFLMSERPSRAMWLSDELSASSPDCFSFGGIAPHELIGEPPAEKCNGCPFDQMGSGKGRQKKCKTKANDFVLLVRPDFAVEDGVAVIKDIDIVGPGLVNYSIGNKGASQSWQGWLRTTREAGLRPQGVVAKWSFGELPSKSGVLYNFVKIETIAPLPSPAEAPEIWSKIVAGVQGLKSGQKEEVLVALSGLGGDSEDDDGQ